MRNEQEMFALILHTAKADDRILAVLMNGSRANPQIKKDRYQDYDIVYVVTELSSFLADPHWIDRFGELAILQCPELMDQAWQEAVSALPKEEFTYLMLFQDINRIDLKLMTLTHAQQQFADSGMGIVLYDETQTFQDVSHPELYWINQPSQAQFHAITNEFWWCLQNVGKGLVRDELPYARGMMELYVRTAFHQMLDCYIGIQHGFQRSSGKLGNYYQHYLSEELWQQYQRTCADGTCAHLWEAIDVMCDMFHQLAVEVAHAMDFPYHQQEEDGIRLYLDKIKR